MPAQSISLTTSTLLSRENRPYLLTALLALLLPLTHQAYKNYQAWLALGPGGMPYTLKGWLLQWTQQLLSPRTSMRATTDYDDARTQAHYGAHGGTSFLARKLPPRQAPRPHVPNFFAPQRQVPANSAAVRKLQTELVERIAAENAALVELRASRLEGGTGIALWLKDPASVPAGGRIKMIPGAKGEVGHIHSVAEGSGHVILSLADAREVIETGWGQKHMGSGGVFPHGYTMMYAPESAEDVEVMGEMLRAGIRFMSGGKEVS